VSFFVVAFLDRCKAMAAVQFACASKLGLGFFFIMSFDSVAYRTGAWVINEIDRLRSTNE
jgi:hypothetical protein